MAEGKLPPAMRDPDPWKLPGVNPRGPNPQAKLDQDIPDMSLRLDPAVNGRGLHPDDTHRSLRGVGVPLMDVDADESSLPSNAADPKRYRMGGK